MVQWCSGPGVSLLTTEEVKSKRDQVSECPPHRNIFHTEMKNSPTTGTSTESRDENQIHVL